MNYRQLQQNQFVTTPQASCYPEAWNQLKLVYAPCLAAGNFAYDYSLNRFHGSSPTAGGYTFVGSPLGRAIEFDSGLNRLIQWTAINALNGGPWKCGGDGSDITLEVFLKYSYVDAPTRYSMVFRSDQPGVGDTHTWGYLLELNQKTGILRFHVFRGESGLFALEKEVTYTSLTGLTADRWYHVFVTFSPVESAGVQMCAMVIDGVLEFPSITLTGVAAEFDVAYNTARNGRIGGNHGGNGPLMSVALLRIWNRSLISQDYMSANYGTGLELRRLIADPLAMFRRRRGGGSKASRRVSIGGTALRRMNVAVAG